MTTQAFDAQYSENNMTLALFAEGSAATLPQGQDPVLSDTVATGVIAIILIVALSVVVFYFAMRQSRERVRYWIVMQLMALIITAFVSFLAVMSGAFRGVAEVAGQIGLISFTFAGAPAIFFTTLYALKWMGGDPNTMFHDEVFQKLLESREVTLLVQHTEKRLGWITYDEWKIRIGFSLRKMIDSLQTAFIDDLLPHVYYHGESSHVKPIDPSISTLFVYTDASVIKFQRIRGKRGDGANPKIYLPSTPSSENGVLSSIHVFARDGKHGQSKAHKHADWVDAPYDVIDCMICTIYSNDLLDNGDYIYIDTRKYIRDIEDNNASVAIEVAMISVCSSGKTVGFHEPTSWLLSSSANSSQLPVPLIFKKMTERPVSDKEAIKRIKASFGDWLEILASMVNCEDSSISKELQELLLTAEASLTHTDVEKSGLRNLFKRDEFTASHVSASHVNNVVISVVEWH